MYDPKGLVDTNPLTLEEAKGLLGPESVAAIESRGIELAEIDWNGWIEYRADDLDPYCWYHVARGADPREFGTIRIPLYAHLLRSIQNGAPNVWANLSANADAIRTCSEAVEYRGNRRLSIDHFQLLALLTSQAGRTCEGVDAEDYTECLLQVNSAVYDCLRAIETLRSIERKSGSR